MVTLTMSVLADVFALFQTHNGFIIVSPSGRSYKTIRRLQANIAFNLNCKDLSGGQCGEYRG